MSKLVDETGKSYGYLTVIKRGENTKEGRARWLCKCKCGNEVLVLGKHLRSGNTKSCGCLQKERAAQSNMNRADNLIGKRFGRLVVLEESGFITGSNGKRRRKYLCQCDCGNKTEVQHQYLAYGDTNSCGCISSVGNMTICRLLNKSHIKYKTEYSFENFISNSLPYRYDFALFSNDDNLLGLIEYQGDIHFRYNNRGWNNKENFEKRKKSDKEKFEFCKENDIKLYYITYKDDIEEKLKEILDELYSK